MCLKWVNECCIRQEGITVYCLCMIKYVRVSILERLYLSIHPWRLVLDQLLGEGPDHKNLRILFDLGWPWKISPGFKSSPNLESIWKTDWVVLVRGFRYICVMSPKGEYPKLTWNKRKWYWNCLLYSFLCIRQGRNKILLIDLINGLIPSLRGILRERERGLLIVFSLVFTK